MLAVARPGKNHANCIRTTLALQCLPTNDSYVAIVRVKELTVDVSALLRMHVFYGVKALCA